MPDEDLITEKLEDLYTKNPAKLLAFLALVAGKACVEANAAELEVKTEADIENVRREITVSIKLKRL